jgi:hypothetical protein
MEKNMPTLGIVLMGAVIAAWIGGWVPPAVADAPVEQTGQTQCWNASGNPIDCAGTGQDGEIQAGHPLPRPRFVDQGDGAVEDKLTDLIWLKNADCFSFQTWQAALNAANNLADDPASTTTDCGLSDGSVVGDWRLPNVKELQSLIHFGFFNPALSNALGTAKWTEGNAFSGVQSTGYWSSTTNAVFPDHAWFVHLYDGSTFAVDKDSPNLVWPVRGVIIE